MSAIDRTRAALRGTIDEIKEARRAATEELISFRAGEKLMAARATELAAEITEWQRRAEQAVLAGDDDLAKQALDRRAQSAAELARVRADREEQAQLARDLLRARRELDKKLAALELREGTIAGNLAALDQAEHDREIFARFDEAEKKIDEDSIEAELAGEELDAAEMAQHKLGESAKERTADAALAELKRKMKGPT